ncbi:MAG: hypothetical protein ACYTBJ_19725, partial [Planctomycetota bacterium]
MNDDPQKYTLDEVKVRKFYSNVIESGTFTVQDLGSEDDFVAKIAGDPDKFKKVRANMIGSGVLTEDDLGGSESMFLQPFLKKKDVPLTSGKISDTTPESPSKPKEVTEETDRIDLSYYDYHNQTNQSAPIASSYKNQYLADHRDDEAVKVVDAQTDKDMHTASNIIAEEREKIDFSADEKTVKKQVDALEERLESELNPHDRKNTTVRLRQQLAEGTKDELYTDLDAYRKAQGVSMYDLLTNSPKLMEDWRNKWKRKLPGEVVDAAEQMAHDQLESVVLENENDRKIQPKVADYKAQGYSDEEALDLAMNEYEIWGRQNFEANINKKEYQRYENEREMRMLYEEDPKGNADKIYFLQEKQKEFGPKLYDEQGRRIKMPEVEQQASYELEVNDKIDEVLPTITSREQLGIMLNEQTMIYKNLHDSEMERSAAYAREIHDQPVSMYGHAQVASIQDKKDAQYSSGVLHEAEIKLRALQRMYYLNQDLALMERGRKEGEGGKRYYGEVIVDAIRDANHGKFGTKVTRAETRNVVPEIAAELGMELTQEQIDALEPDIKEELSAAVGHGADFVAKLLLFEAVAGASGISAVKNAFQAGRRVRAAAKFKKAGKGRRFVIKSTNKLESSIIDAGMNEARFQAAGMEPGEGAAFHYVDKGIGRVVPILLRGGNKNLALIANSLARNPFTMTASMEIVATTRGAIEALANDKIVSEEMKLLFGDTDAVGRRVAVELMIGAMFGMGEVVKASRKGIFITTPEYVTKLQEKAIKNDRPEVAAELADLKFKLIEADAAGVEARNMQKKADYLIRSGVETKDIFTTKKGVKGRGNRLDFQKVNEEFDLRVAEDPSLYDKVLGKGSHESLGAKAKILKKAGVDIEGHSDGNIEAMYQRYQSDPKYATKVRRFTEQYEIKTRRQEAKAIGEKLKSENIGEGYSESTDADIAMRQKRQAGRSEVELEFMKSYKRTRRDTSKKRLDQWGEKYKRVVQGEWKGTEAEVMTEQMLGTVNDGLALLKDSGIKGKHTDKLKAAKRVLEKSIKDKKPLSNEQADLLTKRITDSQNAFTVSAMRAGINEMVKTPAKTSGDRLDPKGVDVQTSFLMKAIDRMFNKQTYESRVREGSEQQVINAEKRLDDFRKTELQVEEMLTAREKDPLLHEGQDFTVYEGVRDAMRNGATHKKALDRRAELRTEAEGRTLTEREMIEYEVLGFADGSKMSMNQLAEATRALKSLVRHGRSEYKVKQEHQQIRDRLERYNVVKAIDPKSVDFKSKVVEPNMTGLNVIQRLTKSARGSTESFTTTMEWLMSRTAGRDVLTGELHSYSDRALKAGNDKHSEIGYFVKEMIDVETQIFGDP